MGGPRPTRGLAPPANYPTGGGGVVNMRQPDLPASARSTMSTFVLVVDAADFPGCCRGRLAGLPRDRFVVVGREPGAAYRDLAASQGAGAWIPRERLGEDLVPEVLRLVGEAADAGPRRESQRPGCGRDGGRRTIPTRGPCPHENEPDHAD